MGIKEKMKASAKLPVSFSIVAQGDVLEWKDGAIISGDANIVHYLRHVFAQVQEETLGLSDDQIMIIAKAVPISNDHEQRMNDIHEALVAADKLGRPSVETLIGAEMKAKAFGAKIGAETVAGMFVIAKSKEDYGYGSIAMFKGIQKDFTVEQINSWPEVDSRATGGYDAHGHKTWTEKHMVGTERFHNSNPCIVKIDKGTSTERTIDFYQTMALASPAATGPWQGVTGNLSLVEELAAIKHAEETATQGDKFVHAGHKNKINMRVSAITNKLKNGVTLFRQKQELSTKLPNVTFNWVADRKTGGIMATTKPIYLSEKVTVEGQSQDSFSKAMSVSSFCNLDIDAAVEAGGTMAALEKTGERAPVTAGTKTTTIATPQSQREAEDYLFGLFNYFDNQTDNGKKRLLALRASMNGKNGEAIRATFQQLMLSFDPLWTEMADRVVETEKVLPDRDAIAKAYAKAHDLAA
jgi:hypothetical protein